MLINTNLIPEEDKGPGKHLCLICEYGLHEEVDKWVLRGKEKRGILKEIRKRITQSELKEVVKLKATHLTFHLINCSSVPRTERLLAKKARYALEKEKKTIEEVNEMVMGHIAQSLELSASISEDDLKKLSPREKLQFATEATKLLQTEKRIALEAKKTGMEEAKFLQGIGKLASGAVAIDENEKEPVLELKDNV